MTEPQRNLFEVALDVGEVLLVQSLSPYVRAQLWDVANGVYPDPDAAPYEREVPNAAVPGMKTPADQNEEYRRLKASASIQRLAYFYELLIDAGCVVDTVDGHEVTLARYADDLAHVRRIMKLEGERNDFQDCVKYVLLRSGVEIRAVANAGNASLTNEEVMRGIRSFRYYVERSAAGTNHYRKAAPRPEG